MRVERARLIENLALLFALHSAMYRTPDRYIFDTWEHQRKADLLRKVIGDFCGSSRSVPKYTKAFDKLLKDLQKE